MMIFSNELIPENCRDGDFIRLVFSDDTSHVYWPGNDGWSEVSMLTFKETTTPIIFPNGAKGYVFRDARKYGRFLWAIKRKVTDYKADQEGEDEEDLL